MPATIRPGIFCLPLFSPKYKTLNTHRYTLCPLYYIGVKLSISQLKKNTD